MDNERQYSTISAESMLVGHDTKNIQFIMEVLSEDLNDPIKRFSSAFSVEEAEKIILSIQRNIEAVKDN